MKKRVALFCACAGLLFAPSVASATDIDTSKSATSTVASFGYPNTATYGQTFTAGAGDTFLNSFSMFLNGAKSNLTFRGYLATWDGSKAGKLLYSSADRLLSSPAVKQEYFFAPLVAVTPESQYVAFLSVSQLGSPASVVTSMPYASSDVLAGGSFVYSNNGTDFGNLFTSTWSNWTDSDAALRVDFSAGAPAVPEPATWGMMILGFGAAGFALRRTRRRADADTGGTARSTLA